jgi:hypothetical protein
MAAEKKLETLEEEIKLMKGELKQSLTSVRDYLLNMELPASEFAAILTALGNDNSGVQKLQLDSLGDLMKKEPTAESTEEIPEQPNDKTESPPEDEDLIDVEKPPEDEVETLPEDGSIASDEGLAPEDSLLDQDETGMPEDSLLDESEPDMPEDSLLDQDETGMPEDSLLDQDETSMPEDSLLDQDDDYDAYDEEIENPTPESGLSEEEAQPMEYDMTTDESHPSVPRVNLLANLINWVAKAKKEIGHENIPTFLEVYGISGHMAPELKELIMHLAEITAEQSEASNAAAIWSQSMLSLHGILTGGDSPRHPAIPSWSDAATEIPPAEEEIIEVDKPKEMPVKLKLVFPNGNGESKEFCINLTPEVDSNNPAKTGSK